MLQKMDIRLNVSDNRIQGSITKLENDLKELIGMKLDKTLELKIYIIYMNICKMNVVYINSLCY